MRTSPITPDLVRGALELEPTARGLVPHRLPSWARAQTDDAQLAQAEGQPAGVRVTLRTTATVLELDVLPTKLAYSGAPPRPDGLYDLLVDGRLAGQATAGGGHVRTIDMTTGTVTFTEGPVATVRFDGLEARDKLVEVWLPHNETTELVALRSD
ncbi:MAG: lipase, partial [Nocardioides sp.]